MSRLTKLISLFALAAAVVVGVVYYVPLNSFSVQQKPEQAPQKVYDYYIILDESSGEILMYVPLVVSIDDELISETNKRYRIVKIVDNQAYARFVEDLNLEQYQKK